MRRKMMHSKIHRARITEADLHYEGSITIDKRLMEAADILPYESVHVWNVTQGTRIETYVLPGPTDSGVICINGAAAHRNNPDDIVILCTYCELEAEEAKDHEGICVRVNDDNEIIEIKEEIPGPKEPREIKQV